MAVSSVRLFSERTDQRSIRVWDVTPPRAMLCVDTIEAPSSTEDGEWAAAFASPSFAHLVARAREQIAKGQTKPLRLEDL